MCQTFERLSPAELIIIVYYKQRKKIIRSLLKYTVYDFILKGIITVQKKRIKSTSTSKKSAYFIKLNKDQNNDFSSNFLVHENKVLDVLQNRSNWISFQEFVTKLSHFKNDKFRIPSRKYRIENYVLNELQQKQIFIQYSIKIFKIVLWKKYELSQEGQAIKKLLLDGIKQINNYSWLIQKYAVFNSNLDFFHSSFFLDIDNHFDQYFQHALDSMGTVVSPPAHWLKTYPEEV